MIVFDNVLWDGKVTEPEIEDSETLAIKELNNYLEKSQDLYCTLLPIRDGLFLVTQKEY